MDYISCSAIAVSRDYTEGPSQNNRAGSGRVVTPAKAEVQEISDNLDSGFRRNDGKDIRHGVCFQLLLLLCDNR